MVTTTPAKTRRNTMVRKTIIFAFSMLVSLQNYSYPKRANGSRYPLVGGTRESCFDGTNFKPRKLPENAQSPTRRVHAVLGGVESDNTSLPQCSSLSLSSVPHILL